jgi:uncharacterized protein (TIGR00255 family)
MALSSMTGFAALTGQADDLAWTWEARSVNGRGLDLRLRLPEGFEALDAAVRQAAARAFARGSITAALKLGRGATAAQPRLNPQALEAALAAARAADEAAARAGLALAPMTAADLLAVRGVIEAEAAAPAEAEGLMAALAASAEAVFAALAEARALEGAALAGLLAGQLDKVAGLVTAARATAEARAARNGALLRERLEAVLALIAVKADVTEELDRLEAHVAAARALIAGDGPVGRKLDFLMQEFNREANTLCSKAGAAELTALGLELKVVVDQMREQVQNVE